jgi:hypothetical protein
MMQAKHDWNSLRYSYAELLPNNPRLVDELFAISFRHILLAEQLGYDLGIRESMRLSIKHYMEVKALLLEDTKST